MARGRPSRATIYRRLDDALDELNERFGGLPTPKESETVWSDIWHLEAHHSTALEGNTLVLREVAQLLDQRRAVGAKPLKEYLEVEGYSDAARWVYGQALDPDDWSDGGLINLNEVRRIHHMAMTPVWGVAPPPDATAAESPGSFRQHDIAEFGGGMTPPPWPEAPAMLAGWVANVVNSARLWRRVLNSMPRCQSYWHSYIIDSSAFTPSSTATDEWAALRSTWCWCDSTTRRSSSSRSSATRTCARFSVQMKETMAHLGRSSPGRCSTTSIDSSCQTLPDPLGSCRWRPLLTTSFPCRRCDKQHSAADSWLCRARTESGAAPATQSRSTRRRSTGGNRRLNERGRTGTDGTNRTGA